MGLGYYRLYYLIWTKPELNKYMIYIFKLFQSAMF